MPWMLAADRCIGHASHGSRTAQTTAVMAEARGATISTRRRRWWFMYWSLRMRQEAPRALRVRRRRVLAARRRAPNPHPRPPPRVSRHPRIPSRASPSPSHSSDPMRRISSRLSNHEALSLSESTYQQHTIQTVHNRVLSISLQYTTLYN